MMARPLLVVRDKSRRVAFRCHLCESRFYDGELRAFERHVAGCADAREQQIRESSLRSKAPALYDTQFGGPVDLRDWVKANRQAIIEGRKRL
jgi:hypothetical protein